MKFLHRSSSKIEFRRELPSFEVEATAVEHIFQRLYSYVFDMGVEGNSVTEMDRPEPNAIFIVDFVKVRMDPRNREIDLDRASQIWLGAGSFVLSLAEVDPNLMMEDESMVWTNSDVVVILKHQNVMSLKHRGGTLFHLDYFIILLKSFKCFMMCCLGKYMHVWIVHLEEEFVKHLRISEKPSW
ncbi:hypothetical protein K1719_043397 [Acacia pycnantha]|nr:hypothetical protein K1719_043397 [Acacia pycnantha]